jgi:hypothetical protein
MSLHTVEEISFDFATSRPIEIEISESPLSSDAGLLPIGQFDSHIGLTSHFAEHGTATHLWDFGGLRRPERS